MTEFFSPTTILWITLFGFFILVILLWAICLRWGLRWVHAEHRGWSRVTFAALLVHFVIPWPVLYLSTFELTKNQLINTAIELAAQLILVIAFLMLLFRLSFGKAVLAWMPTLLSAGVVLGLAFVFKAYVFESFQVPTNSMAPTILGDHATIICPTCGKLAHGSAENMNHVICENFHITNRHEFLSAQPNQGVQYEKALEKPRDHILAAKFLKPRRWDIITFHWPPAPEIIYVKRLIGLPGETIVIRDGAVWANDVRLEPPPELQGIKYYMQEMPRYGGQELHGSEANPAKLGPDEFFVLGDFTAAAADSRYWQHGAPGHSPYAVPKNYVTGVVTHSFWPWQRMRSFEQH